MPSIRIMHSIDAYIYIYIYYRAKWKKKGILNATTRLVAVNFGSIVYAYYLHLLNRRSEQFYDLDPRAFSSVNLQ